MPFNGERPQKQAMLREPPLWGEDWCPGPRFCPGWGLHAQPCCRAGKVAPTQRRTGYGPSASGPVTSTVDSKSPSPFLTIWLERALCIQLLQPCSSGRTLSALSDLACFHPCFLPLCLIFCATFLCQLPSLHWEQPRQPLFLHASPAVWLMRSATFKTASLSMLLGALDPGWEGANSFRESKNAQRNIKHLGQNTVVPSPLGVVLNP